MQAVIVSGKSQYLVFEGQELLLDAPTVDKILLIIDGDRTLVGQPEVLGAKVKITDLGEVKGDKLFISKFKAKSRYRRQMGFRPRFHKVKIEKISVK